MATPARHRNYENGGALAELVLSIPLLAMLVGGMVFVGQKISLYGSASQTTFNTALYAAGLNSTAISPEEVKLLGAQLLGSSVKERHFENGITAEDFELSYVDTNSDNRADVVTVKFAATMQGVEFGGFGRGRLSASTTMPILGQNLASTVNPSFQNPATLYCGDGSAAPGNNTANCNVTADTGNGCTKLPASCKVIVEASAPDGSQVPGLPSDGGVVPIGIK